MSDNPYNLTPRDSAWPRLYLERELPDDITRGELARWVVGGLVAYDYAVPQEAVDALGPDWAKQIVWAYPKEDIGALPAAVHYRRLSGFAVPLTAEAADVVMRWYLGDLTYCSISHITGTINDISDCWRFAGLVRR